MFLTRQPGQWLPDCFSPDVYRGTRSCYVCDPDGLLFGKAKFDGANRLRLTLTGIFLAVLFHGTYDYCLFLQDSPDVDPNLASRALFIRALVSLIIGTGFPSPMSNSPKLSQQTNPAFR